jgi:hypothetical protein
MRILYYAYGCDIGSLINTRSTVTTSFNVYYKIIIIKMQSKHVAA